MQTKSLFTSRTFWVNLTTFILGILSLPDFVSIIPVSYVPYIALVSAVLNMIIRMTSNNVPVSFTGGYRPLK